MRKVLSILGLLVFTATNAQQITVTQSNGTPISDGQVFTFNSLEYEAAYFGFLVHNNSASNLDVRIMCENVVNATGAGMELCFGDVCLASVSPGHAYPSSAVTIAPGGTNSQYDHFLNTNAGTGTAIDYVFKFYIEDEFGDPVGNTITTTYRYDPNALATNGFSAANHGAILKSSIVSNNLEIKAFKNIQMELFDVNGKSLRRENLTSGEHTVDVSDLASGMYILSFNSENNQKSTAKFIKK
jgi:hypothetical protein